MFIKLGTPSVFDLMFIDSWSYNSSDTTPKYIINPTWKEEQRKREIEELKEMIESREKDLESLKQLLKKKEKPE